jgi:hypothetical protein
MMQKLFLLLPLCAGIIVCTTTKAQTTMAISMVQSTAVEKELLTAAAEPETAPLHNTLHDYKDIHIRAVRHFMTTYKEVDTESWYVLPNGYRARFEQDGVVYYVTYDKRGYWLNTIRQYSEQHADREILDRVKMIYDSYRIFLVEEIEYPGKPLMYMVHMENNGSWRNIRIYETEMETVLDIEKL